MILMCHTEFRTLAPGSEAMGKADVVATLAQAEIASKTDLISATLRDDIFQGRIPPGSPLPNQREIAKRFDVSEATASIAIVRLAHEELVVRRRGRGTYVNARLPIPAPSRTLHFVRGLTPGSRERLNDLAFIEDSAALCDAKRYAVRWHHIPHQDLQHPEALLDRFRGARGVITKGICIDLAVMLYRRGIPTVAIVPTGTELSLASAPCPQITYDRRATSRMAVEHLVKLGYSRIAFLGPSWMSLRILGFFDGVQKHKLPIPVEWVREIVPANADELINWLGGLKGQDRPQALCCSTDHVANLVERWLLEKGVRVPEDLAVMACDEGPEAIDAPVPITTVGDSRQELCGLAIETVERIKPGLDPSAPSEIAQPVFTPLHLTVRQSCGANCSTTQIPREVTLKSA